MEQSGIWRFVWRFVLCLNQSYVQNTAYSILVNMALQTCQQLKSQRTYKETSTGWLSSPSTLGGMGHSWCAGVETMESCHWCHLSLCTHCCTTSLGLFCPQTWSNILDDMEERERKKPFTGVSSINSETIVCQQTNFKLQSNALFLVCLILYFHYVIKFCRIRHEFLSVLWGENG